MQRENFIDYAKTISIAFVVFIHTGFSVLNNIVLFAMPVFFAATGYTYTIGKRTFGKSVLERFKSIMIPFWVSMLVYTILEVICAYLFNYGTISIAVPSVLNGVYGSGILPFNGGVFDEIKSIMSYKAQPDFGVDMILPLNCHLWFLPAMFTGYIMYLGLVKITLKNHFLKVVAVIMLLLVASLEVISPNLRQLPLGICRGALGTAFMLSGFWAKEYGLFQKRSTLFFTVSNILSLTIFAFSICMGSTGDALVRSYYGDYGILSVFLTFAGGVAGAYFVFNLCRGIDRLPIRKIKDFLSYFGKNVMTVYLWHMVAKFLLDAVYICVFNGGNLLLLDEYKMGLLPENAMLFMIFEGVFVIALCLAFTKIKLAAKQRKKCE